MLRFTGLGQDASAAAGVQCPDGSIVADSSLCSSAPATATTFTCDDGTTVDDPSQCSSAASATPPVTCPDGSTAADLSQCPMAAAPSDSMQTDITGFLTTTPSPTSADIAGFLKLYSGADRMTAAQALIQQGVDPNAVSAGYGFISACDGGSLVPEKIFRVFSLLAGLAGAYHGVRRHNGSIGWGIWWGFAASMFPVLTTVLAIGQGFAKPRAA